MKLQKISTSVEETKTVTHILSLSVKSCKQARWFSFTLNGGVKSLDMTSFRPPAAACLLYTNVFSAPSNFRHHDDIIGTTDPHSHLLL